MSISTKVINLNPDTKEKLNELKRYKKETYNEVVERLIANQKE